MVEAFVATEPELRRHYEGVRARVDAIPVNRETYGFCHCDYAFTNFIVDGGRFCVIDANAFTGPFALDLGAVAGQLERLEIDRSLALAYWRRFTSAYAAYTAFDESWIPWIHAMHDSKRLAFYVFIRQWIASGSHDSHDLSMLETWRREMLEDRPWITLDLSL